MDNELIRAYRELDADCAALYYRLHNAREYEETPFIPVLSAKPGLEKEYAALCARIDALSEPELQFSAIKAHLRDFLQSLGWTVSRMYTDPRTALGPFMWKFEGMGQDHRTADEKERVLKSVYARLPEILDAVREWTPSCTADTLRGTCASLCDSADAIMHENWSDALRPAMEAAANAMRAFADSVRPASHGEIVREESDERSVRMDPEEYRAILRDDRGVDLDDLLDWGIGEADKTRARCFELAKDIAEKLGIPAPQTMTEVNDMLNRYAGPASSPEEMMERSAGYLARTRALARSIVPLPKDENCLLTEVPWKLRYSFPWGGYSDGDPLGRPLTGRFFMNTINYKNVTDGWMRINSLHEAYPGHHVQFVRAVTDPIPETMKIGARNIPLMEGMCHRTEVAYAYVYDEDPFYPLFAAYRRHHTAVRIRVDLMLFYYGNTIAEAVEVYKRELGFDQVTARGQVQAHMDMIGYFTCYYYGVKKITDWEQKYGWERDDYTRLLFSLSTVSLDTFRRVLDMTPAQRESFLHDFASLRMDPNEKFFD